jgi:hypothetical protein
MRTSAVSAAVAMYCLMASALPAWGQLAPEGASRGAGPLRYRIDAPTVYIGTIASMGEDGTLRLEQRRDEGATRQGQRTATEGYFLGLAQPATQYQRSLDDAKVLRVLVTEVLVEGALEVQVDPAAVPELEPGSVVSLLRPQASTTELMHAAPALASLVDALGSGTGLSKEQGAHLRTTQDRLKQIGLALHNFHDVNNCFPPAVVFGPDGKPWHSWRVLILPYLEEASLYDQYSFDEPWNGPNNRRLLKKTPAAYRDPTYGADDPEVTHVAAIVGKGTAFPAEGIKYNGKKADLAAALARRGPGVTQIRSFTDGTTNSLVVGSVDPGLDIAWTRPEDLEFSARFPAPGGEGGFAAPYQAEEHTAGVFLFADGHGQAIRSDTKDDIFRKLLTISGGELVADDQVKTLAARPRSQQILVIEVAEGPDGPVARLVEDTSAAEGPGLAPDEDPLEIQAPGRAVAEPPRPTRPAEEEPQPDEEESEEPAAGDDQPDEPDRPGRRRTPNADPEEGADP